MKLICCGILSKKEIIIITYLSEGPRKPSRSETIERESTKYFKPILSDYKIPCETGNSATKRITPNLSYGNSVGLSIFL